MPGDLTDRGKAILTALIETLAADRLPPSPRVGI